MFPSSWAYKCREQLLRVLQVSVESVLQSFLLIYNVDVGVLFPWFRLKDCQVYLSQEPALGFANVLVFMLCISFISALILISFILPI